MRISALVLLLSIAFAATVAGTQETPSDPPADTVLLLLFDGFAADRLPEHPTPELDRLAAHGAFSDSLEPVFPSVSLPNGVSVSTGCWPARHGIVGNRFIDPVRGRYDHSRDADWLRDCEHLHQAVERQGGEAAVFGWYGGSSGRFGALATTVGDAGPECADGGDDRRLEEALGRLRMPPGQRPDLLLVYLCGPDDAQHFAGIDSEATAAALAAADARIGRARAAVEALPDSGRVALVVTTDHGMAEVDTLINITRILRAAGIEGTAVANDGMAHVYLDGPADPDALRELASHREFATYLRESLPAWMNLGRGRRVGDLVLLTEPPYFFADVDLWPWHLRFLSVVGPRLANVGGRLRADHGYDPRRADMQGILAFWGAGVPAGLRLDAPRAIDVHPTVLALLGLEPLEVDGRVLLPANDPVSVE